MPFFVVLYDKSRGQNSEGELKVTIVRNAA